MRYIVIVGLIGVGVGLIAFGFVATGGDHLASFDPHHPATFLPSLESRLRVSRTAAGELLKDLAEGFIAPYREGFRHNVRAR
jgi:hypothetical protein